MQPASDFGGPKIRYFEHRESSNFPIAVRAPSVCAVVENDGVKETLTAWEPTAREPPLSQRPRQNPWNLRPLYFAALVALTTALLTSAFFSGIIVAVAHTHRPTPTTRANYNVTANATGPSISPTPSPMGTHMGYTPYPPSSVASLSTNCSAINGTTLTSPGGTRFHVTCPQLLLGTVLTGIPAYALQDCVDACALMNLWRGSTVCNAVSWLADMAAAVTANQGANCWLFNSEGGVESVVNSTSARMVA